MPTEPGAAPARPLAPRSRRVRQAVLDATLELLLEGGLPAATVDAVNARSGVSKATIYKHWPNRTAVAIDAYTQHMAEQVPTPADSGDARADLVELLRSVCAFYSGSLGAIYAQLLAQSVTDPAGRQRLHEGFLAQRRAVTSAVWQRAVDQGLVRPGIDVDIAVDSLVGPVIFRLVSGHAPLTPDQAEALADATLDGLLLPADPR
ncbi:TetR/AcrR family transcriptional regulator C-terminal ligand-binding domain-containing protein [Streptomyces olivoreticuli]